jgi:predicted nucleotidyltransferase component of viral defense system
MTTQDDYYSTKLYPFQDGIIEIFKKINTPFYLTGGTAINRCYFNHRYSDDLDYFVNSDKNYSKYRNIAIKALEDYSKEYNFKIMKQSIIAEENYTQVNLLRIEQNENIYLKIDMINDIAQHFGEIQDHDIFGRIDNYFNIFSNKLSAIYRFEPKDIADIWIMSKHLNFDWKEQFNNGKEKEAGLDVQKLSEIIKNFPIDYIDQIKWAISIDKDKFINDLSIIAYDILMGNQNSLKSK